MKKLLIYPYNENGIAAVEAAAGEYEILGFIDDREGKEKPKSLDYKVFSISAVKLYPEVKILAVPGSADVFQNRRSMIIKLGVPSSRMATVIHKKASVSNMAKLGYNLLIGAGAVINGGAEIKNHICIMPNAVVHRDAYINDYSYIASNVTISAGARIGRNCYLQSGASVAYNVTIGDRSLVGFSSSVTKSLPKYSKVVGNPAYIVGRTDEDENR